jgi:2-polyprenyl-3-methyl-5-hydroxy-6-metoxy-1,4-benzoquinol methylase
MTSEELEAFYTHQYRQLYQSQKGPTQKDSFVQRGRAYALAENIIEWGVFPKRVLDIGCSSGILMEIFQERFGCEVFGVEPDAAYREYAEYKGFRVYASLDDFESEVDLQFDLITMAHVLEHLTDPVGYLEGLKDAYITPDGWLLLEVPNLYTHDSFEIAHISAFSEHTLRQTLQKAGFGILGVHKHGRPRSKLLPLYLTMLARPARKFSTDYRVKPERHVRLKRRIGLLRRRLLQKLFPKSAWEVLPKG